MEGQRFCVRDFGEASAGAFTIMKLSGRSQRQMFCDAKVRGTKRLTDVAVATQPSAVAVNVATNKIYVVDAATTGTNTVLLDSGLRLGEPLALQWSDVHLEPVGSARYGWLQVRDGKSKNAKRTCPLVALLEKKRKQRPRNGYCRRLSKQAHTGNDLAHMHTKGVPTGKGQKSKAPLPFQLRAALTASFGVTRLGAAGADAFTIMKLAGPSSVAVSQRYVHPTGETVRQAFNRLEALHSRALEASSGQ
jgi:hypothetical protein